MTTASSILAKTIAIHVPDRADVQPVETRLTKMGYKFDPNGSWDSHDCYLIAYGSDTTYGGHVQYLCLECGYPLLTVSKFFDTYGRLVGAATSNKGSACDTVAAPNPSIGTDSCGTATAAPANPPEFIIDTGGNAELSRIVQELAFKAGLVWQGPGAVVIWTDEPRLLVVRADATVAGYVLSVNTLYRGLSEELASSFPIYSASTEMGEIVRLLSTPVSSPPPPKPAAPVGPTIHGQQTRYSRGCNFVAIGCATISLDLLRKLNSLLNNLQDPQTNRHIASVTSSNGETLTADQIKSILTYVAAVDAY